MPPPAAIGPEDPVYYGELLNATTRPTSRRQRDVPPCPDLPGIQGVDDPLANRLRTILDVVADISLCSHEGNVSATMAQLREHAGTLHTQLYILFNYEDQATRGCPQYLESIFEMLRNVSSKSTANEGSPKVIEGEFQDKLIEISGVIHNRSFNLFAYRVNKRKDKLSMIRSQIENDQRHFGPEDRLTLLDFLDHVELIIRTVAEAQDTKRLPTNRIRMLLQIYAYWTDHNLLPRDPTADNVVTLLDKADLWLNKGFLLRRWAVKIMSFVISTNRLFMLTQSRRLYKLFQGKFFVTILPSPPTTPYRCKPSSETIKIALDSALADTSYPSAGSKDDRESFKNHLMANLHSSEIRWMPTVHAELAMIMAMVNKQIDDVFPCIGVSKLSCIMCSHYIDIFKNITKQVIATKGSYGKAYPGWFWPNLPSIDGELRPAFMKAIRQQLLDDYFHYVAQKRARSNSDSSVGSDLPMVEVSGADKDGILMSFEGYVD